MATTNEKIRDDVISQDVVQRRVIAHVQSQVHARLHKLSLDLRAAMEATDPFTSTRPLVKRKRVGLLRQRANNLIRDAHNDCYQITRDAMQRIAVAKSKSVVHSMDKHIP